MEKTQQSFTSFLRVFKIIHIGLVLGITVIGIFAWVSQKGVSYGIAENDIFIYVVPLAALMGYFASKALFQRMLSAITIADETSSKIATYQTASLVKYALIEGPAFLALIAFMLNGNALHLSIGIGLWLLLAYDRPTKAKLARDLPLTMEEKQQLNNSL